MIEIQHASKSNVPALTIFRASKSSQPGEEVALYAEPGTGGEWTSSEFGALTFAKVDDEFYGYFVANYTDKSQTTGGGGLFSARPRPIKSPPPISPWLSVYSTEGRVRGTSRPAPALGWRPGRPRC